MADTAAVRAWRWIAAVAIAAALGCGASRAEIRYGSLQIGERSLRYDHGVESFTLPDGLVVALAPDPRANLVTVDVRYRVGAADDPSGKSGLAHLVEHVMFQPRSQPGGPSLADRLSAAALYHNASTSWDATHFRAIALAGGLDELLAIELARMTGGCAGVDAAAFDRERAVVLQELVQRGRDELVTAIVGDVYGGDHRYVLGEGGRDVAHLTLADVCRFTDAHYTPDRAILVIAGRIDAAAVRRRVTARFGALARRAGAAPVELRPPRLTGEVTEHASDTDEAGAVVIFPAAPWGSLEALDDELVDRLLVLRLGELDHDRRWITRVDTGTLGGPRNGARYFTLSVADPADIDEAVAELFRIAADLPGSDSGVALGAIAARWRSRLFDQFESVADRGLRCAEYLQLTDHRMFHLRELAALQVIDPGRLRERAVRMVREASRVVRVRPTGHARVPRPRLVSVAAIDAPAWQAAVDLAEAARPLALPAPPRPLAVRELRLTNGLRVLLASDFTQPVFEARLVFPVGDFNAGPGGAPLADGAAELLNHDVQRAYPPRDLATLEWVMRLGARLSAEVDETTTFAVRGSSTFADWHLWRLHWLLESGIYAADDVRRANRAVARDAGHRDAERTWRCALREAVFGRDHPYARDAGAAVLDGRALEAFRDAHYRANGATLIIVGKFDAAAMTATVTELFGAWSGDPPPPLAPTPAMRPVAGPRFLAHTDPDAEQVRITVAFATTSPRSAARGARTVLTEMLRGRLDKIRTRLGASYGMQTSYTWTAAGDTITLDGYVDADRAGEVLRRIQADLSGLRGGDAAFTADFIRARRTALARTLADPMQSSLVADQLEAAVTHHLAIDESATLPAAIARTLPAAVRDVIAADLRPARMVVLLSGRPSDAGAAFAAAGITGWVPVGDGAPAPADPTPRDTASRIRRTPAR